MKLPPREYCLQHYVLLSINHEGNDVRITFVVHNEYPLFRMNGILKNCSIPLLKYDLRNILKGDVTRGFQFLVLCFLKENVHG